MALTQISTAGVKDDAVTSGKIPANAVGSSELADNAVTGGKVADSSITDAKVHPSAAIAGTKISANFGSQNTATTGIGSVGELRITSTAPKIVFTDSDTNPDYEVRDLNGVFHIKDLTNAAVRMQINTDGHVDITDNLDVGAGLDVTGDITATGSLTITNSSPEINLVDSGDNPDYRLRNQDGTFRITDTTNNAGRFVVNSDGHIDVVGNLDVGAGLDVTGAITGTSSLTLGNGSGLNFGNTSARIIGESGASGLLRFDTNGGEKARIDSSGRLLLNKTSPTRTTDALTVAHTSSNNAVTSFTLDANNHTGTHANALIYTKSKNTYWNGLVFESSHGHIGALLGKRDSAGGDSDQEIRMEIGGNGPNDSEEKTWKFRNNGNLALSAGHVELASGYGIDFSATGDVSGASSVSEILDDYEEGTYVPTVNGNMSLQSSYDTFSYVKIGKTVTIRGLFYPNNNPSSNNVMTISLPFASANYTQIAGAGATGVMHRQIAGASNGVALYIQDNVNYAELYKNGGSGNWQPVRNNDWQSGMEIYVQTTYFAA